MADKDDKENKEKEPEIEIVEVDDAGKPLATGGQAEATAQASAEAEPPETDEDDQDDERLKLGSDDEQKKKDRKLREERRKQFRQKQELELRLLKQQNADMAARLAAVETHTGRQDLTLIDDRIKNANRLVQQADAVLADAITKQDGKRYAEAMKVRDDARDQVVQLSSLKVQLEHRARADQERAARPETGNGLPPAVASRVQAFQARHPWYDAAGRDVDSGVIQRLDQAVADEGFDPGSQDYWDELERRAAKYLPHRFEGGERRTAGNGQQRRSGPPMNGGGEATTTVNGKKMVYITPARKQAMIDAGAWDDPARRQRMLKQYEKYDRENPPQRGAA